MRSAQQIARDYSDWKARYADRMMRHYIIDEVMKGNIDVVDPDEEEIENRSPNLIQIAAEDTAEAASLVPTVRARPTKTGERAKKKAREMEQAGAAMLQANNVELYIPRSVLDLGVYGLVATVALPDFDERRVVFEKRDPRYCYPEPGFRPGDEVRRVAFARDVYWSQLPAEYQMKIMEQLEQTNPDGIETDQNTKVQLIEYFDENEIVVVASVQGAKLYYSNSDPDGDSVWIPVELSRWHHGLGVCPVVVEARITHDGEFRGQFDQVTGMLAAHVRLMGLMLDYADQAVYSDVWVRDLIGEMPYGGGAFIELGPNGAIGRVPPAVSSLDVTRDLENLVEGIHVGGRWPKSRPGEIDQSIASAKFLETSAGLMNTAIRTYHLIMQRNLQKLLRIGFAMEKEFFGGQKRSVNGVLRNQEFLFEYDPADWDDSAEVIVEYGLGLGRDPSNSAVLHIQYAKEKFISKEFVQEHIDGVKDVAREQMRLDMEDLIGMMKAKLLQGVEQGTVPDSALVAIAKDRQDGASIVSLFEKYIVEPQEEQQEQGIPTGMFGSLPPGVIPGPGAPGGPGGAAGLPAPPEAPGGAQLMARMNSPAGPGGTLGTQVMAGG